MNENQRLVFLFASAVLAVACSKDPGPAGPPDGGPRVTPPRISECDGTLSPPAPDPLGWKRITPFMNDLGAALDLAPSEVCNELDLIACASVHLVPLGGNDAEGAGQFAPVASPLATTPMAIDRIMLSACENAAARDQAGSPRVFTDVPPSTTSVAPESELVDAQITSLYRRLLRRDPTPAEIEIVRELATSDGSPRSAHDFDVLACFAIGTTTENVLF